MLFLHPFRRTTSPPRSQTLLVHVASRSAASAPLGEAEPRDRHSQAVPGNEKKELRIKRLCLARGKRGLCGPMAYPPPQRPAPPTSRPYRSPKFASTAVLRRGRLAPPTSRPYRSSPLIPCIGRVDRRPSRSLRGFPESGSLVLYRKGQSPPFPEELCKGLGWHGSTKIVPLHLVTFMGTQE